MTNKKHRKLFPLLASETNKTLDCSIGVCDSICPYNCFEEPDYTVSPWSSPQPIKAPSPSISAVYQPSENSSSSIGTIAIIAVTGAVLVILLAAFFIVAKFFTDTEIRVNHGRDLSERDGDMMEEEIEVDHPIWLIRTTGLQQSIINSITICNYKRGDGLIERTDCPVCLNEFEEDESLRILPKCNHAFHISCIDTWLRSHTNCPLCRAGIEISVVTPQCSGLIEGSGSRLENDGEDQDRGEIENRGELGRGSDELGFKERLNSSYPENSDVRIEISGIVNEINRNLDGSETETKEKVQVLGECLNENGGDSIDTHKESVDFPGKSRENQSQNSTRQETVKENKPMGDEASCSEENSGQSVESLRSFDSGESYSEASEDTEKSQSGISSNTSKTTESTSVSCFNTNKSSVFPL